MLKLPSTLALAAVLLVSASAQTPPAASTTPAETFIGAYASATFSTSPKPTGGSFVAIKTSLASGAVWSITGNDYSKIQNCTAFITSCLQSAAWTGVATPAQILGRTVYLCGGIGGATTLSSSGYVVTACGILAVPINHGKWGQLLISPVVLKSSIGGSQELLRIGWGVLKQ
jgi:hypothetical protein